MHAIPRVICRKQSLQCADDHVFFIVYRQHNRDQGPLTECGPGCSVRAKAAEYRQDERIAQVGIEPEGDRKGN
jgi:hypothetical protein